MLLVTLANTKYSELRDIVLPPLPETGALVVSNPTAWSRCSVVADDRVTVVPDLEVGDNTIRVASVVGVPMAPTPPAKFIYGNWSHVLTPSPIFI